MLPKSRDVRDTCDRCCCCICGKMLNTTDNACFACKDRWGLGGSMTLWPEWARFLWASEQARRRRIERETGMFVSLDADV